MLKASSKIKIERNQVYRQKGTDFQILVVKRKGDKWLVKVLTEKTNVFRDTHTMSPITIYKKFDLING